MSKRYHSTTLLPSSHDSDTCGQVGITTGELSLAVLSIVGGRRAVSDNPPNWDSLRRSGSVQAVPRKLEGGALGLGAISLVLSSEAVG